MEYVIIILYTILVAYIILYYKIKKIIIVFLKIIISALFVLIGILAYLKSNTISYYATLIITGLIFGFLGDIVLGLRHLSLYHKNMLLIIGMTFFLLGHMLYTAGFLVLFKKGWPTLLVLFIVALSIALFLLKTCFRSLGAITWAVFIYFLFLEIPLVISLTNALYNPTTKNTIITLGIVSFIMSDILLFTLYFKNKKNDPMKRCKAINIITYYLAQTLIAISIIV